MARVTHVKRAQQRYKTVPVLDDDGQPKQTPVMKNGVQKVTKRGKAVFMTVTMADKNRPLPPYTCDYAGCPHPDRIIEIGSPLKHITPKSGPYGGRKRTRHEDCPTWQVWEYSSSLSARLAQISHDFWNDIDNAEGPDDVQAALDDASSSIEELAGEKREGAENIESGFGHPTSQSEELESMADELESWASEVSSADIPEMTECAAGCNDEQIECPTCGGTGTIEHESGEDQADDNCDDCDGTGETECDDCDGTGEDIEGWREEVRSQVTIVDESPV